MEEIKLDNTSYSDKPVNAYKVLAPHLIISVVDDPIAVKIIPSGWSNPQMYHVIVEWGDMDQADHHLLDADQIKEQMGIEVNEEDFAATVISKKFVNQHPNNYDLGETIRKPFLTDEQ